MPDIRPDLRVGFVLAPRFTLMAFASFVEGLRHAADEADFSRQIYCHWRVIAPDLSPIRASCGIEIRPQAVFPDPAEFDHIVVVGGLVPQCLEVPEETLDYLRRAYLGKRTIVGLCTGGFLLAKAGLLDDRLCAVDTVHLNQLKHLFPAVLAEDGQAYIDEGDIVTCRGGTAALTLVTSLIEARCGKARAVKTVTALHLAPGFAAHRAQHRPYGHLLASGVHKIEQAIELMESHIASPLKVSALASHLNTSARELNRLFAKYAGKPPTEVWRDMRLAHGHWLLLNSSRSVTQIALECGFADGAHFTRWFKRAYGETPVAFRDRRRQV